MTILYGFCGSGGGGSGVSDTSPLQVPTQWLGPGLAGPGRTSEDAEAVATCAPGKKPKLVTSATIPTVHRLFMTPSRSCCVSGPAEPRWRSGGPAATVRPCRRLRRCGKTEHRRHHGSCPESSRRAQGCEIVPASWNSPKESSDDVTPIGGFRHERGSLSRPGQARQAGPRCLPVRPGASRGPRDAPRRPAGYSARQDRLSLVHRPIIERPFGNGKTAGGRRRRPFCAPAAVSAAALVGDAERVAR